jgi:hypothetical protein
MRDQILDDLIQHVLDGTASAADCARLESRLAADALARDRHAEMSRVFRALGGVRQVDPPAGLNQSIMHAVRNSANVSRAGRSKPSLTRFFFPAAAGFAAGLLCFAALTASPAWRAGHAPTSGTIGGAREAFPLLALGSPGADVSISAEPGEAGSTVLELRTASEPAVVSVSADVRAVTLVPEHNPAVQPAADSRPGDYQVLLPARTSLRIGCRPGSGPLAVRISVRHEGEAPGAQGTVSLESLPWSRRGN